MGNGAISQEELNSVLGDLEELPLDPSNTLQEQHIWLVKNKSYFGAVVGGRCWSYTQAKMLLDQAQKSYPEANLEIIQYK